MTEKADLCYLQPLDPLNISFSEDKCVRTPETLDKNSSPQRHSLLNFERNIVRHPSELFSNQQEDNRDNARASEFGTRTWNEKYKTQNRLPLFGLEFESKRSSSLKTFRSTNRRNLSQSKERFWQKQEPGSRTEYKKKIGLFCIDDFHYRKLLEDKMSSTQKPLLDYKNRYQYQQYTRILNDNKKFMDQHIGKYGKGSSQNDKDLKKIDNLIEKIDQRIFLSKRVVP